MSDQTGTVGIVCPTCRQHNRHNLGWLKTVPAWDCSFCGAALELDYADLTKFLSDDKADGAEFIARLSPRNTRGITTRRTR